VLLLFIPWLLRLGKFWFDLIEDCTLELGKSNHERSHKVPEYEPQFICMDLLVLGTWHSLGGRQLWWSLVLFETHDIAVEICPILQSCFGCRHTLRGKFRLKEGRHLFSFSNKCFRKRSAVKLVNHHMLDYFHCLTSLEHYVSKTGDFRLQVYRRKQPVFET
jgi:hypothetical protein